MVTLQLLSEHSLLKAKQPQLFQPHLIHVVLQSLNYLSDPSLGLLQHVPRFLLLGSPELDIILKMWYYWSPATRSPQLRP